MPIKPHNPPDPKTAALLLEAIAGVESSYGTNKNHNPDKKYGTAAGMWGLKPAELKVLPNRLKNRGLEVPKELEDLKKLSHDEITKKINENEKLDYLASSKLAEVILGRQDGNLQEAAYRWHKGVLAPLPKDSKSLQEAEDGYVDKVTNEIGKGDMRNPRFRKILEQLAGGKDFPTTDEEREESVEAMGEKERLEYEEEKKKERKFMQRLP